MSLMQKIFNDYFYVRLIMPTFVLHSLFPNILDQKGWPDAWMMSLVVYFHKLNFKQKIVDIGERSQSCAIPHLTLPLI